VNRISFYVGCLGHVNNERSGTDFADVAVAEDVGPDEPDNPEQCVDWDENQSEDAEFIILTVHSGRHRAISKDTSQVHPSAERD